MIFSRIIRGLRIVRLFGLLVVVRILRAIRGDARVPSNGFIGLWWSLLLIGTGLGLLAMAGYWLCAPLCVLILVVLMPWTVARRVCIPLGMSRAAGWLSALSGWTWCKDMSGGGLVAAAWAVCRQRMPDRDAVQRIEAARDRQPTLTAAQVLATGLLAAARADMPAARWLLESVDVLGPRSTPSMVHKLAREWLVADAVACGDWARAADLAPGQLPRSRMTRFLGAAAARIAGHANAPESALIWAHWLVAPMRRRTYDLARRAAAAPMSGAAGFVPRGLLGTSLPPDRHADALSAHVAALQQPHCTAADIARLAEAWDQALAAPETRAFIMQRASALGASAATCVDRMLLRLGEEVAEDLAGMVRSARLALGDRAARSPILSAAQGRLHEELLGELELAFDALSARVERRHALSSVDEWREWLSLLALHRRAVAVGGLELGRLAFPHVHHIGCKLAVWLWNERREHLMANAMFRWLLDEAMAVGDAEAIELENRNWDKAI